MNSLSDAYDGLRGEWSALESQWQSTRAQWTDTVGGRFEKEFWNELEEAMPEFLRELQRVDDVLDQALSRLKS
jgi:hypothetical protein